MLVRMLETSMEVPPKTKNRDSVKIMLSISADKKKQRRKLMAGAVR
jgi:hypothetical protein